MKKTILITKSFSKIKEIIIVDNITDWHFHLNEELPKNHLIEVRIKRKYTKRLDPPTPSFLMEKKK